ncbi:MAG: hypothetical protein ACHQF2_03715 [Flavobacteriales bacterium]
MSQLTLRLIITLSVISFLQLTQCGKSRLEKYNADFEGTWRTDTFTLVSSGEQVCCWVTIDGKDSFFGFMCSAQCPTPCNCTHTLSGRAKINKKRNQIYIGNNINNYLKLTTEPFIAPDGRWAMVLSDLTYYKQ